jgi:MFS transporter, OPA family, glycerol-3-phosphate transporter
MSIKPRSQRIALVLMLEVLVGAILWFGTGHRSEAQPASPPPSAPSAPSAPTPAEPPSPTTPPAIGSAAPATAPIASVAPSAPTATATAPAAPVTTGGKAACPLKPPRKPKPITDDLLAIGILVAFICFVTWRLPKVDLGHTAAFKRRRLLNWLPLGLTYSFLYFGRYNIKLFQGIGLNEAEYASVFGVGTMVYGISFLLNGPLTDRWGGRATILISAAGSAAANLLMGYMAATGNTFGMSVPTAFSVAYGINMYFQSFGAVSIVKVNGAWFHLRERGTFGGIFGILISLGLYFAFDWGARIVNTFEVQWLFWIPGLILILFFVLSAIFVRNQPSDAGLPDFDLGDASTVAGPKLGVAQVFWKMLTHPVLMVIAFIELCSGFLRQAILQWGTDFGKGVGLGKTFVFENWGLVSCIAGITGGMFAGAISDHLFQSRRSPVSAVLYGIMVIGAIAIVPLFAAPWTIGWAVAVMSMAIIGVHGMLTATASADFAGKQNVGVAVGLIDGFVYIGATAQSYFYGYYLPASKIRDASGCLVTNPEAGKIDNWHMWPYGMIPVAVIGLLLTLKIWNARPNKPKPPAAA